MALRDRIADINHAAQAHAESHYEHQGKIICTVSGLTGPQAAEVKKRFQSRGWAAQSRRGGQVRAERNV